MLLGRSESWFTIPDSPNHVFATGLSNLTIGVHVESNLLSSVIAIWGSSECSWMIGDKNNLKSMSKQSNEMHFFKSNWTGFDAKITLYYPLVKSFTATYACSFFKTKNLSLTINGNYCMISYDTYSQYTQYCILFN